ncbi:TerC/Alx family metal homeostasis membrane protein [Zymobacter sp. IVIA_12111.31 C1]|uniref:TerC/Alx family metal homeostasis membrane protein n=1 Tax=Zymobacter sp. IVIA_12111.31 C1 TaxID=3394854 RepID=UPI0039C107AF
MLVGHSGERCVANDNDMTAKQESLTVENTLQVPGWVWGVTLLVTLGLFVFDFVAHVRKPHAPTLKESAVWSAFFIALAILFGIGLTWLTGPTHGGEFFAGFVTEKSLSVDNLFVFALIMAKFSIPPRFQQKALLIGVGMALVMRGGLIALGAAALERYSWLFYLFGLFLLYSAVKLIIEHFAHNDDSEEMPKILVWLQRWLPISDKVDSPHLLEHQTDAQGRRRWVATPIMAVVIALGITDLLFAFDSIPAIYGLTSSAYIVFTANAFALLGLIQLYFLLHGLMSKLTYLGVGLSCLLAFIGVKLVLHALHQNTLPFINDGQPLHGVPDIGTGLSLSIIGVILGITVIASLIKGRQQA